MLQNPTGKERLGLALLLSTLGILGPLNIDMYLPSFPGIAADLGAQASLVQLSLTSCLIGLAIGQIIVGPISDARGRRGPLLISLLLFAASSVMCALAGSIEMLIAARFLQGLTASGGIVLSRAVVRDVFSGRELTQFFSLLMVINAVAPLLAPIAGGAALLLSGSSWHTIFYFLGLLGVLILLTVAVKLPETLPPERRMPSSIGHSLRSMGGLLRDRSFMGYALTLGFIHGGSFAYVAGTPFVYQQIYGVSPQAFSILFGINGIAIITGSFIIGRFSSFVPERSLLRIGVITAGSATLLLLIAAAVRGPLFTIVVPLFVYMITIGITATSTFTLAIARQGHRAGSASAVLGLFPLLIGAAVSPLVGIDETTPVPMGAILFVTALLGGAAFFGLTRPERPEDAGQG
ncbi:Bcr/CflA family efflux MFS transporter [Saccharibacillus sp. CPCC 101409]|uniref:Bcr/CflA family efflux MFS transporter n=1 Tax=Saccharibacillus sp. CPCC 101409 TaxID=3058041 RepID=UPI00267112AA|nr:Bcr/CflA family efflux MFS transporter [Saccharibacillus sp. CPCC 101409]MDO3412590.1 Bcr/CflA family efflux MFS transporter [Saccharibacillus sp. CPCC 101409]